MGQGGGRWRPPRRPAEQPELINDRCPTVRSLEPRPPRRPTASPCPHFRHRANPSPRIIHRKFQQVQRRRTRPAEVARYSGAKVPRKNEPGRGGHSIAVGTAITTSSPSAPAAPAPRRRTSGRTRPPPGSTPPPPSPLRSSPSNPAARPSAIGGGRQRPPHDIRAQQRLRGPCRRRRRDVVRRSVRQHPSRPGRQPPGDGVATGPRHCHVEPLARGIRPTPRSSGGPVELLQPQRS